MEACRIELMIPKFSTATMDRTRFITEFALKNEACILDASFTADWPAIRDWRRPNGAPNVDYLIEEYGLMEVPITINQGAENDIKKLECFIKDHIFKEDPSAYLKDWHFQTDVVDVSFRPPDPVYKVPSFLDMDWLNNENWMPATEGDSDYRFLYFGAAGTWTEFHVDVMSSYSWSANICGRKLWLLVRPGAESVFSIGRDRFVKDIRQHRERWSEAGVMEIVQEPGEIMFIPTGWHHQVHNLETAISLNHNVVNAFNVNRIFELIETRLKDVENEIEDIRDCLSPEEFDGQCQDVLLSDVQMNRYHLFKMVTKIIESRRARAMITNDIGDNGEARRAIVDVASCLDTTVPKPEKLDALKAAVLKRCECVGLDDFCPNCRMFWRNFEYERALSVYDRLKGLLSPEDTSKTNGTSGHHSH